MATIKYRCSICKREIDLLEKTETLTVYSKCIITNGCKGKLNKLSRNIDNNRESTPSPVDGLNDYVKRKVFYQHTQTLIKSVWTIKHNLGVAPTIEVFINQNNSLKKLKNDDYSIEIKNKNLLEIKFNSPYTGIVQCIARSTVQDATLESKEVEKLIKVSFGGSIVFAFPKLVTHFTYPPIIQPTPDLPIDTKLELNPIRLEISVISPNREEFVCTEIIDTTNLNNTPWVGWNEILLRKRRNYSVKSKNIFKFNRVFQSDELDKNKIPAQTQIRFLRIDYGTGILQPIEPDDVLILLADSPYQSIDKIKNKIIDIANVNFSPYNYFSYVDGELYTSESNVENIFPYIQKVN